MRTLGFDAAVLGHPSTGGQQFAYNLMASMLAIDPETRYRLAYVGTRDGFQRFAHLGSHPNVTIPRLLVPRSLARWKDYVNYGIGGLLAGPVDVYFTPNFHLPPLTLARRRAVVFLDMSVQRYPQFFPRPTRWHDRKMRLSVRLADVVITISDAIADEISDMLGVPRDRVKTVYCAPHERYRVSLPAEAIAAARARHHLTRPYLISVSTLQPRKNYVRLIEAWSRLPDPDIDLVIVGGRGWLDDEIFAAAQAVPRSEGIHFLTRVPDDELPALYQGARAFCMPSVYEGFGIPILEAMASGIPVACSDMAAMAEVAGGAAELFDPLDVEQMTAALSTVLEDESRRAVLVAEGYARQAGFRWERSAHVLLDLLRAL